MGLAYSGNRVWIFEGHSTALEAGVINAEILLVDSAMLPFIQKDWTTVARRVMSEPRQLLIHDRENFRLLGVRPS